MSLTDLEKENMLRSFYHERLIPLAKIADERHIEFFPLGPDKEAATYYIERSDDGNYIHEINSEELAADLRKIWSGGDLHELAGLAEELVLLAQALQESEEASEEVSPFIYAMF